VNSSSDVAVSQTDVSGKHLAFRSDIAGLRAVAVLAVVLFHAGVAQIPGGFVGVDVFFVISGFLITGLLLKEIDSTGKVRLVAFWARRVRRLVPAAGLMVVVTCVASLALLSPINLREVMTNAAASALYISNFVFAFNGSDYFAEDLAVPNPFLHTWTLGVEEQFYIVLPIALVVVLWLLRRRGSSVKRAAIVITLVVLFVVSLALSVRYSETRPDLAFYLLPTRLWEFAAGGLLAAVAGKLVMRDPLRNAIGVLGLLGLMGSFLLLNDSVVFPGWIAAIPVVSTLAVISAGSGRSAGRTAGLANAVLSVGPARWIGDISYSLYLWHWPAIVLLPLLVPEWPFIAQMSLALLVSFVLATASYYLVENPIRYAKPLQRSHLRSYLIGFAITFGALGVATVGYAIGDAAERANPELVEARENVDSETEESMRELEDRLISTAPDGYSVFLVGDSHGAQWRSAFEAATDGSSIEFVEATKNACPAIGVITASTRGVPTTEACKQFRIDTLTLIKETKPDIVVLAQAEGYLGRIRAADGAEVSQDAQLKAWEAAYSQWIADVRPHTGAIGFIIDNPRFPSDPNECLISTDDPSECAVPRADVLIATEPLQESSERARSGLDEDEFVTFSTTDVICDEDFCSVFADGLPIYRDFNHLSSEWTLTQVPRLEEFLSSLVQLTR
jgi:peptidoglycan/LPS O-acetylase OafA/YrhL